MQCSRAQQGIPSPSVNPASSEMAELREMLLKQQEQINQLTNSLSRLQGPARHPGPSRPSSVICRQCQKPGHYARECDNERVALARSPAPQTQGQADSISASQVGN